MGQGCLGTSGAVETREHQAGLHSIAGEKEKLVFSFLNRSPLTAVPRQN
jgi:hypothetical protein